MEALSSEETRSTRNSRERSEEDTQMNNAGLITRAEEKVMWHQAFAPSALALNINVGSLVM